MLKATIWIVIAFVGTIGAGIGWGALCEHLQLSPVAAFAGGAGIGVLLIIAVWLALRMS